jgi:hypothetical protein
MTAYNMIKLFRDLGIDGMIRLKYSYAKLVVTG